MAQKPNKNLKRFVIYVSDEEHRLLRSALALKGITVSDWFRKHMSKEIDKQK